MDFLIVLNHEQPVFSKEQMHNVIINLPISDWWHYLPSTYIVRSSLSVKVLADGIIASCPGLLFLIIKIDLKVTNGVLNKSAWDWINDRSNTKVKLKVISKPQTISQLLRISNPS